MPVLEYRKPDGSTPNTISALAVVSLVLVVPTTPCIAWRFVPLPRSSGTLLTTLMFAIPAMFPLITGVVALVRISRSKPKLSGAICARTGIAFGILWLIAAIVVGIWVGSGAHFVD